MEYYSTLRKTIPNGNRVEFKMRQGIQIGCGVTNRGYDNEKSVFKIKGRIKKNKPTKIGVVSVKAPENKMFGKVPGLFGAGRRSNGKNKLKMKLASVNKDANKNVIEYIFDIIYTAKEKPSLGSSMNFSFSSISEEAVNRVLGIHSFNCSMSPLREEGDKRIIKVKGDANQNFTLAITKLSDTDLHSYVDESSLITSSSDTYSTNIGDIPVIKGVLNSDGEWSTTQSFPAITSNTRYSVNLLANSYSSNFNDNSYIKSRNGWDGWYSKILSQYMNPSVTIRAMLEGSGAGRSTTINGVATNASTHYDKIYKGRYDTLSRDLKTRGLVTATGNGGGYLLSRFEVQYVLVIDAGHFTINKTNITEAYFTNCCNDSILSVKTVSEPVLTNSDRTCTLTLGFFISYWGKEDVVMALDFNHDTDPIVTIN